MRSMSIISVHTVLENADIMFFVVFIAFPSVQFKDLDEFKLYHH